MRPCRSRPWRSRRAAGAGAAPPASTQPKLDFAKGLPSDAKTLVVIPTLLGSEQDVDGMIREIELHYLRNPDPKLQFALLTDDLDAEAMPHSEASRERTEARSKRSMPNTERTVRARSICSTASRAGTAAEERFMGWERKRGKLEELNRLLRGDTQTSYTVT